MDSQNRKMSLDSGERRCHLINDFILPSLQNDSFGDLLKWDPQDPSVFMVQWVHKARSSWSENDAAVFLAWDTLKGRPWAITDKNLVDSKQRLRAALRSRGNLIEVKSHNGYRRYKILGSNVKLKKRSKKKHEIDSQSSGSDDSPSNEPPLKKQQTSGNTCAKCKYQSAIHEDFKAHILSHKTASTFQCQECGLCFVSQPSLTKHLRIVHKIRDTLKYIREEGTNYAPEEENPTKISKRDSLECGVCFISFPNEALLKTHRKSHKISDTLKYIKKDKTNYITEEGSSNRCPLECDVCFTIFPTEAGLKIHKRSHGMAFIRAIKSGLL